MYLSGIDTVSVQKRYYNLLFLGGFKTPPVSVFFPFRKLVHRSWVIAPTSPSLSTSTNRLNLFSGRISEQEYQLVH